MPRQRFIWPELWDDLDVAALSRDERLLFIGLFSLADDEGRIPADPRYLKGHIFKYDDDLTVDQVRQMRDRVAATLKNVQLYAVDGKEYIQLRQWRRWQRPRYPQPSRIPPPPSNAPEHEPRHEDRVPAPSCVNVDAMLHQGSGSDDEALPPGMGRDGMDRDGLGRGMGEPPASESDDSSPGGSPNAPSTLTEDSQVADKGDAGPAHADATPSERLVLHELRQVKGYPFDWQRDLEFIRLLAADFPDVDIVEEARKWRTYKLDKPLTRNSNPRSQFRNWCAKAQEWAHKRSSHNARAAPALFRDGAPPAFD